MCVIIDSKIQPVVPMAPDLNTRNSYVLAIDEAGALGYSDQDERKPGEFGLAGGVLYPESYEKRIQNLISKAAFQTKPGMKMHITDMPPEEQARLRQFLEDLVLSEPESYLIFYNAVSAAGYHMEYERRRELVAKVQKSRVSEVKISGANRIDPDWLLESVYSNVVFEAIAWCNDRFDGDYKLTVRFDRTDEGVLSGLEDLIKSSLSMERDETTVVTGYDQKAKKLVKGSVTVKFTMPKSVEIKCGPHNLHVDRTPMSTELALLPDTVVNWISYLLGQVVALNPDAPLNDKSALTNFPLSSQIYRFSMDVQPHIADTLLGRKAAEPTAS